MTNDYWQTICDMQRKQTRKGVMHYGQPLEEETKLTLEQRITYLEEELIDALMYCEHLKQGMRGIINELEELKK